MAFVRDVLRAMTRLDDRVLGRWLDRPPPPLRVAIPLAVLLVIAAIIFAVFTGNATILIPVFIGLVIGFTVRIFRTRPRR